ncbi:MAG: hypothetical protein AAF724_05540 [Pseudomonadota bacterium]
MSQQAKAVSFLTAITAIAQLFVIHCGIIVGFYGVDSTLDQMSAEAALLMLFSVAKRLAFV